MAESGASEHRRRRSLVVGFKDGPGSHKNSKDIPGLHQQPRIPDESRRSSGPVGADEVDSDCSSRSTSEDVELEDMPSDEGLQDDEETGLTKSDRRRRKRRKRRNSRMDARVVREPQATKVEQSVADRNIMKQLLVNAILIGLWYSQFPHSILHR